MSGQNNKEKNNSNSAEENKVNNLKSTDNQPQFEILVDTAPIISSAIASVDGKSITLTFNLEPVPILPGIEPKFFDVKFDGVSVPLISVQRDFTNYLEDCKVATTSAFNLSQVTYNNATGTLTGQSEVLIIDGVTLALNDRVLVKNNTFQNGIYRLSTVGVASTTPWVLTRTTDANTADKLELMAINVTQGSSANIGAWYLDNNNVTLGTTSLIYTKIESTDNPGKRYIIKLASPVKPNMTVTVSYYPGATNFVTNNKLVSPDAMLAFANYVVDTSLIEYPFGYFDPVAWASNKYFTVVPNGVVYERRFGFLSPPTVYDNTSPYADVILHQAAERLRDGMRIHYFGCYATNNNNETSANIIAGNYFVLDVFENTVREGFPLGGTDNPNQFETIGNGFNYYIVNYLNPSGGVFPTVKSIEFGITSSSPKNYVLEARKSLSTPWVPLVYMYASDGTKEFFRYVFKTALPLYAVRLRYRGDYYYESNNGLLSISATDSVSGTQAIRVSHFPNFSDAQEFADKFPNTEKVDPQGQGWVAFLDGSTIYDWEIVNRNRVWNELIEVDSDEGKKIFAFKGKLITVCGKKIYSVDLDGTKTLVYTSITDINAFAIYIQTLYVGLEGGKIIRSLDGLNFEDVPGQPAMAAVKALATFGNFLWIGTAQNEENNGILLNYDGSTFSRRSFGPYDILSLAPSPTYLYVGLGTGENKGQIYFVEFSTTGIKYNLAYSSSQERIDTIRFNSGALDIEEKLWIGASAGYIYGFGFDSTGNINKISQLRQLGATNTFKFLNFVDSPDKRYFWIVTNRTDGNVLVYNNEFNILYDTFRPGDVNINDLTYLNNNVYGIGSNGKIYDIDLTIFSSNEKNVYVEVKDLAGNINRTVFMDNIIFGRPPQESVSESAAISPGKIYQVRIPTIYRFVETVSSDGYTKYTATRKWTTDDKIEVYRAASLTATKFLVAENEYQNLQGGVIQFFVAQSSSTVIFITIYAPKDGGLSLLNEYITPSPTSALFAPTRKTRQTGIYESEPFFAPSVNRWNTLVTQSYFAITAPAVPGDESGLQIDIYVRSANTREATLTQDWGLPFTYSTINTNSPATFVNNTYNIQSFNGKWLQFKVVMSTASQGVTPKLNYVWLSYFTANETYFFTKRFDTATESSALPIPQFRRGLLTFNGSPNGGNIQFKYLTSSVDTDAFDISKYTDITPNSVFSLSQPSRYIRFAILLVSAGSDSSPSSNAIVDEFAVQLDTGETDIRWMN